MSRHWPEDRKREAESDELISALDHACQAEFGFTAKEISKLFGAVCTMGEKIDPGMVVMHREEFLDSLMKDLKWEKKRVTDAVGLFSLVPRSTVLPNQPHLARIRHDPLVSQLPQQATDPGRMRPNFQRHSAARHCAEDFPQRFRSRPNSLLQLDPACFIQHAVAAVAISY
jgi:hypothetical protein